MRALQSYTRRREIQEVQMLDNSPVHAMAAAAKSETAFSHVESVMWRGVEAMTRMQMKCDCNTVFDAVLTVSTVAAAASSLNRNCLAPSA